MVTHNAWCWRSMVPPLATSKFLAACPAELLGCPLVRIAIGMGVIKEMKSITYIKLISK